MKRNHGEPEGIVIHNQTPSAASGRDGERRQANDFHPAEGDGRARPLESVSSITQGVSSLKPIDLNAKRTARMERGVADYERIHQDVFDQIERRVCELLALPHHARSLFVKLVDAGQDAGLPPTVLRLITGEVQPWR